MESITYKTKSGITQFRPVVTSYDEMESGNGFCLACGIDVCSGVEPDARQYECESCGAKKVYGMEELLMMGLVKVEIDD